MLRETGPFQGERRIPELKRPFALPALQRKRRERAKNIGRKREFRQNKTLRRTMSPHLKTHLSVRNIQQFPSPLAQDRRGLETKLGKGFPPHSLQPDPYGKAVVQETRKYTVGHGE